jgi:hypothetical protein
MISLKNNPLELTQTAFKFWILPFTTKTFKKYFNKKTSPNLREVFFKFSYSSDLKSLLGNN